MKWEKFDIGDGIVEGKKIILYAAKRLSSNKTIALVDIGYYLDVPGGQEAIFRNRVAVLHTQSMVFFKEGRLPLNILFDRIVPSIWTHHDIKENNPKEIPFEMVAINTTNFRTFVFVREDPKSIDECNFYFKAWQTSTDDFSLIFTLKGDIFQNYEALKRNIIELLSTSNCKQLGDYFAHSSGQVYSSKSTDLIDALEERGVIHPANVNKLLEALTILKINDKASNMIEIYVKSIVEATSYERFLAGLSSHLTLSVPGDLCDYFQFTTEKKKAVITTHTPGLSLLLTLDKMEIIDPLNVGDLETPLKRCKLLQAVAKVHEYQSFVGERNELTKPVSTLEEKRSLLIEFLKKNIKNWDETMTPLPWKKSCQWKTSDLFIKCGLSLTNSRTKLTTADLKPDCKLDYTDIFTHEKLEGESRIIIVGEPGSGKTMLSSQLAYDWSTGKIKDIDMVIFLPLKFVEGMNITQAIAMFYIPKDTPLDEYDIKAVLSSASDERKTYICLDGFEEYNNKTKDGETSEVKRVMKKEKFSNCTVVLTCRSECLHDLPECPMLKLGRFGKEERDMYIAKIIPEDKASQHQCKMMIENSAFLLDLCSTALLFVFVVHNIRHLVQFDNKYSLETVGPFMEKMIDILLSFTKSEYTNGDTQIEMNLARLSEIAFNGLCQGYQQLMWPKNFLDKNISNMKQWIESGILVVEESLLMRGESRQNKDNEDEVRSIDNAQSKSEEKVGIKETVKLVTRDRQNDTTTTKINTTSVSDCNKVSMHVKFLHKIIQEWFAAKHFSFMLKAEMGKPDLQDLLNKYLPIINPADLHYVLRFTSYLCPESCHLIMSYLHSDYISKVNDVSEYKLNCMFLCFVEYDSATRQSSSDDKMYNVVRQICANGVTILGEDSRLLQQSKISLVKYASKLEIAIQRLRLVDLVVKVTANQLTFNSDKTLEILHTLEVVEVSRWDPRLKDEDYEHLIQFIAKCTLLKVAYLYFPSIPLNVEEKETLGKLKLKKMDFEWRIVQRILRLDVETGIWKLQFGPQDHNAFKDLKFHADTSSSISLRVEQMVNKEGGVLEIPDTGVILKIPPGALNNNTLIHMKIIPRCYKDVSVYSFGSNSTVVVELLPNKLKLQKPAVLILPHCLVMKKGCEWTATIYNSHHMGILPLWKEVRDTHYILNENNCDIELHEFSWETFEVGDDIILGKNIMLYAAQRISSTYDSTLIDIGYYLNLPGNEKLLNANKIDVLHQKPTIFYKDGGNSFEFLLKEITPESWTYGPSNPKEISVCAIGVWSFSSFKLSHNGANMPVKCTCNFDVKQDKRYPCDFMFHTKNTVSSNVTDEGNRSRLQDSSCTPNTMTDTEMHRSVASSSNEVMSHVISPQSKVVDEGYLLTLSQQITGEWLNVGRHLKITNAELTNLQADNASRQETIFQMLHLWWKNHGPKATYEVLGKALQEAGRADLHDKVRKYGGTSGSPSTSGTRKRKSGGGDYVNRERHSEDKTTHFDRDDRYDMSKKGHCLILTYDTFPKESELSYRSGNDIDKAHLKRLFSHVLQFKVEEKHNLTWEDTKSAIDNMAGEEHQDCFICFVCSHGDGESFYTSDGKPMKIQYLLDSFKAKNCSKLSGKPKIFFLNMCLGSIIQTYQQDAFESGSAGLTTKISNLFSNEADFCICLSTVPGYASLRDPKDGTIYVQNLYQCFLEKYKTEHLVDILTYVRKSTNKQMTEKPEESRDGIFCQVSPNISALLKKVYF